MFENLVGFDLFGSLDNVQIPLPPQEASYQAQLQAQREMQEAHRKAQSRAPNPNATHTPKVKNMGDAEVVEDEESKCQLLLPSE